MYATEATDPRAYGRVVSVWKHLVEEEKEGTRRIRQISLIPEAKEQGRWSPDMIFIDNDGPLVGYMQLSLNYLNTVTDEELALRIEAVGILLAEVARGKHPLEGFEKAIQALGKAGEKAMTRVSIDYSGLNPEFCIKQSVLH